MKKEVEKRRETLINLAYFAAIIAIAFFAIRYALGVFMPLFIALVVGALLQKPKNFLVRKTPLKSGAASAICVLLSMVIIVALFSLIGVRLVDEVRGFINDLVNQFATFEQAIDKVETWCTNFAASLPEFIRKTATESVTEAFAKLKKSLTESNNGGADLTTQIMGALSGKFNISWIKTPINGVISTATKLPSMFVAVIITIVSTCFVTSDFTKITTFIMNQFPEERRNDFSRAKTILRSSLGKMAKAYAQIMGVTFLEMLIGLFVLNLVGVYKSGYIAIIAAATAVIDIVPVLGTGTVLIPWAVYSLIVGNYGLAIGLLIIYACISVIRQIIEPKLVAGQLGLSPVVTIFAMYVGLKLFGVLGMLLIPLLVIMLKLLNDEGIIKIWKSPDESQQQEEQQPKKNKKFSFSRFGRKNREEKTDEEKETSEKSEEETPKEK